MKHAALRTVGTVLVALVAGTTVAGRSSGEASIDVCAESCDFDDLAAALRSAADGDVVKLGAGT